VLLLVQQILAVVEVEVVWQVEITVKAGGSGVVILSMPTASYSGTTTGSPTVTTGWNRYNSNIYRYQEVTQHRRLLAHFAKLKNRKYS
jgi:hypothetical protein